MQETKLGTVRIAPSVLATIVSLTVRSIRGVVGPTSVNRPPGRVLHRPNTGSAPGVILQVRNDGVIADVYIVAQPDANLKDLGIEVQKRVREAMDHMVGMPVEQVNIYVEDVTD